MKKECFSELIDHGHGKCTLFGRVLADTPDDPGRQNVRSANIAIPPGLDIGQYVVSATFVTEDPHDANQRKPFFGPFRGKLAGNSLTSPAPVILDWPAKAMR